MLVFPSFVLGKRWTFQIASNMPWLLFCCVLGCVANCLPLPGLVLALPGFPLNAAFSNTRYVDDSPGASFVFCRQCVLEPILQRRFYKFGHSRRSFESSTLTRSTDSLMSRPYLTSCMVACSGLVPASAVGE